MRIHFASVLIAGFLAVSTAVPGRAADVTGASVTFNRDVLPILQKNCQSCHRPGEIGPMALLTYEGTRPWAKAMKAAVLSRKMPPWFADPQYGHFSNDRSLSEAEINTLASWADSGAVEGDAKDKPAPVQWVDGWNIPKPDVVVEMPNEIDVPAKGTIEYTYIIVPTGFTKDTWVEQMEMRPGNRAVVHHANIYIRRANSPWLRQYPVGVPFVPEEQKNSSSAGAPLADENVAGYVPGKQTVVLSPGKAKLIPAGSDIVFQMHYTANGTAAKDRTKFGMVLAKEPPEMRVARIYAANNTFVIPPGASDYRAEASTTLQADTTLVSLKPHMHLRGKSMEFRAVYPNGEKEVLLNVPNYNFNWQLEFILAQPKVLPKGTRLEMSCSFDNSPNNKFNPDPAKEVRWGDQSWEEMAIAYFEVGFNPKLDIPNLFPARMKQLE
ncbi:MAG TPA: cytochrome c [Bryobacteraceae bacterium]|nr:cytochrome c [Bryobacteraceae bacterium]